MGQRISDEEKIIKNMSVDKGYDDLDIKVSVMNRVRAIHKEQNSASGDVRHFNETETVVVSHSEVEIPVMRKQKVLSQRPSLYSKKWISGVGAAVLVGTIGYGIVQLTLSGNLPEPDARTTIEVNQPLNRDSITIMNSEGKVVLETVANAPASEDRPEPTTSPEIEKYISLVNTYEEQVKARLSEGEMAAYYVNDAELNELDKSSWYENQLHYAYNPIVYSEYQDYVDTLKLMGDYWPSLPSNFEGGYEFDQGIVVASHPYMGLDTEFKELFQKFHEESEADKTGKKLFMKKVPWNAIEQGEITYKKGEQRLTLDLTRIINGGDNALQMTISAGETAEKWLFNGKEALFISAVSENGTQLWYSQNRLYWYDEESQVTRYLSDKFKSELTRDQWKQVAASFVR